MCEACPVETPWGKDCKPCPTTKPFNDKGTCKACPSGQRLIEGKCKKANACPKWAPDYTGFACVKCPPERPKATKHGCAPHSCGANQKYDRRTDTCITCPKGSEYARNRNQCLSVTATKGNCLAKAVRKYGSIVTKKRKNLVAGRWSFVPPGCSVQSGGDWAAHWNDRTEATNDGSYTPVLLAQKGAVGNANVMSGVKKRVGGRLVALSQIVCEDGKGLQGNECVDCPKTYNGKCVDKCKPQAPHLDGKKCVPKCEIAFDSKSKVCIEDCPSNKFLKENGECTNTCNKFVHKKGGKQYCVNQCDSYHNGKNCVAKCPKYSDGKKCVSTCPKKRRGDTCVDNCNSSDFVVGNVCLNTCPDKTFAHQKKCLAECPSGTMEETTLKQCITQCPSKTPWYFPEIQKCGTRGEITSRGNRPPTVTSPQRNQKLP